MKVGILGQRGGWHEKSLQEALDRHGIKAGSFPITAMTARQSISPHICILQEILDDYDALFVRAIPGGSLEQIIYRVDALHAMENQGIRILNPPGAIEKNR